MMGTVARLVVERGFGFIDTADGQQFFFHRSALNGTDFDELAPGIGVEFEVKEHATGDEEHEGPRAVNVHLAPDALPAVDNEVLPPGKVR